MSMSRISKSDDRLSQLKELRTKLGIAIDNCESMRDLASLSKQFRETIKEIDELEGSNVTTTEIDDILCSD